MIAVIPAKIAVIPAKAVIHFKSSFLTLDPRLRGDDILYRAEYTCVVLPSRTKGC